MKRDRTNEWIVLLIVIMAIIVCVFTTEDNRMDKVTLADKHRIYCQDKPMDILCKN